MKCLVEVRARNTEPQRGGRSRDGRDVIWNGNIYAGGVLGVVAGDYLKHESGVHGGASDWA